MNHEGRESGGTDQNTADNGPADRAAAEKLFNNDAEHLPETECPSEAGNRRTSHCRNTLTERVNKNLRLFLRPRGSA